MGKTKHLRDGMPAFKAIAPFFIALILLMLGHTVAYAQGDLLVTPLRIVFEGSKKSQEINLANVGKDSATYAISVKNYRMKDDGGFEEVDTPDAGQRFAEDYIRVFPRKVTLAPNESQVIKVQLKNTGEMKQGEYRSHLYFRAVPADEPLGDTTPKKDSGISISLKPIFGITTPVIIRVGDNNADVTLSDARMEWVGDKPVLHVTFNRTGDMSVYGDLTIDYVLPGASPRQVKLVKGIAVYTPGTKREFKVDLDNDENVNYHQGQLHLVYKLQTANDKNPKTVELNADLIPVIKR